MSAIASQVFGWLLICVAVMLAVWELCAYRRRHDASWLVTPRRLRRRAFIAFLLALIGTLFVIESRGLIPHTPTAFVSYVSALMLSALLLLVLSAADAAETARNAAAHSMSEFERAVQEGKGEIGKSDDNPPEPE